MHAPKRLRGGKICCRQHGKIGFSWHDGKWLSEVDDKLGHIPADDPFWDSFSSLQPFFCVTYCFVLFLLKSGLGSASVLCFGVVRFKLV